MSQGRGAPPKMGIGHANSIIAADTTMTEHVHRIGGR